MADLTRKVCMVLLMVCHVILCLSNSAGTNVYLPHSKVLLIKRTNVRIICFFDFCITILLYDLLLYYHINHLHNNA